jgi:hypothetical protein
MICDECETVAHCRKNGCVPKQPSKDEVLKMALYALDIEDAACRYMKDETPSQIVEAITAIKQALAAPVQQSRSDVEPVAWWVTQMDTVGKIDSFAVTSDYDYAKSVCDLDISTPRPLIFGDTAPHAAQPTPVPLTDEQIKAVIAKIDPNEHYLPNALRQLARAIEAKLKEKNL